MKKNGRSVKRKQKALADERKAREVVEMLEYGFSFPDKIGTLGRKYKLKHVRTNNDGSVEALYMARPDKTGWVSHQTLRHFPDGTYWLCSSAEDWN